MKNKKFLRPVLVFVLCLSFLVDPAGMASVEVRAASSDYINRCHNSIQNASSLNPMPQCIGYAYLVGEDDVAAASWLANSVVTHALYAVDPDTEIQGNKYDSIFYPQDNIEYLKDIKENYGSFAATNQIYNMPEGAQYIEREGCKFTVVACDEKWVTIFDQGYQAWDPYYASSGIASGGGCQTLPDAYMETHPAGFYKIQRSKVWLDLKVNLPANHPYNSVEEIPNKGTGVVTKLVKLRPHPNENEKEDWKSTPVYALPKGTEVTVVSTELIPSETPGSTSKYYKVSFNGSDKVQNNTVYYLAYKIPGVFYIDSRYLNFTKKGTKMSEDAVPGEITNVSSGGTVYVYKSKDLKSEQIGILTKGVEIQMFPEESDEKWTTVYFSGQKCYVQTKYIKKGKYTVTDISKLCLADIVNDQCVVEWNPGKNNVDFYVEIAYLASKNNKKKVLWSSDHYTDTRLVVDRKYMSCDRTISVTVQANTKNEDKGKAIQVRIPRPVVSVSLRNKKYITVGKNKIKFSKMIWPESIQYSTKKNFKKAKILEKRVKKNGNTTYKAVREIKKLKPNTTYYIRFRDKQKVRTAAGEKWLSGAWSKPIKVKTKKK